MREGGGVAAIGAAIEGEPAWAFWGTLIGSRAGARSHARSRPPSSSTTPRNPSTKGLPRRWTVTDAWYTLPSNPRSNVHVLAGLDETSYDEATPSMGRDHPISWCRDINAGRSWYTGLGHDAALFADAQVRRHLLGGIRTAIGGTDIECGATIWANFQKTLLTREVGEPMDIAVLPDRRVLMTDRRGRVRMHKPDTGEIKLAAELNVYAGEEDGLQTVAIDPDFATNHWVYLYYARPESAPCTEADQPRRRPQVRRQPPRALQARRRPARPGHRADDPRGPTQRDLCCHVGGDVGFDSKGNLYLTTGDNTNSWASDGFSPIDERPGRAPFDAQRSSANTNDLRGKLLRIKVGADGSYTVPDGNLFGPGRPLPGRARQDARPRSTRWATATRSASPSTRRPTGSTWARSARTPRRTTPTAARASTRSSTSSSAPATAAGRTASAT